MTSTDDRTKVIIIGAGIAGPPLATFLKQKGYFPVLYERTSGLSDRGIGHGCVSLPKDSSTRVYDLDIRRVAANGLRVLSKIDGLLENMESAGIDKFISYSVIPEDKCILLEIPLPSAKDGIKTIGVRRSVLHKAVIDAATRNGVEIKWNHKLVSLKQQEDSVKVTFEDGFQDTASFVVGCDGLHSNTRICIFGEEKADYTGLVQVGSWSACVSHDNLYFFFAGWWHMPYSGCTQG